MTSCLLPVDAVLMLGPTGSGKTPLGEFITSRGFLGRRAHHMDFGSELRSIVSGIGASSYTPAERGFLFDVLEHGLLLENEHFGLAAKVISFFLERSLFRKGDVLVLNGFPRHEGQARDISGIATIHALVVLICSLESIFCRIEDNTGGDRTGRVDDERTLIEKKLTIYSERTAPLIKHYEAVGSRIYRIAVNERTTAGSAYHQLSTLAAADPPVSLVAEPPKR